MNIEILSAKNGYQIAMINGKKYEFNFADYELSKSIAKNYSDKDIEQESGLSLDDYSKEELCDIISERWDWECVEDIIADTLDINPDILIDHLISE